MKKTNAFRELFVIAAQLDELIAADGRARETAERLLASRGSGGAAKRSPVSLLAREELELDGPVEGGLAVRLRIEHP